MSINGQCGADIPVCHLEALNDDQTNEQTNGQTGMSAPHCEITRRRLPHWTCDEAIYYITFRLADSMPQVKLDQLRYERDLWLRHNPEPWDDRQWREYNACFGERMDRWLDAGYGSCALAKPEIRAVVCDGLLRFEGIRLQHHAAVIMPNHVHLLTKPLGGNKLSELMKGIKGASARKANQILGVSGEFWLDESFDHIVRNEAQYRYYISYIENNPVQAGLQHHQYWLYQGGADIPVCHLEATNQCGADIPVCYLEATNQCGADIPVCHLEALNDDQMSEQTNGQTGMSAPHCNSPEK